MKLLLGYDSFAKRRGEDAPVLIDTDTAVNGHILMMGMSGSGKTHNLRKLLQQMMAQGQRDLVAHVFDVHGDIDIPGADTIMLSEVGSFGINPFILNTDLHEGGVRKRIQAFINIIRRTSYVLGDKQEAVLRNLLMDVYAAKGFSMTDPSTWDAAIPTDEAPDENETLFLEVPYDEKDEAKALGARWSNDPKGWYIKAGQYHGEITRWPPRRAGTAGNRTYPTLNDLIELANRKVRETHFGVGGETLRAMTALSSAAAKFNALSRRLKTNPAIGPAAEEEKAKVERAADAVRGAMEAYLAAPHAEGDDDMRYGNLDVLKSVVEKLENLKASGIFKNRRMEFAANSQVHRYHIKSLSDDEQKMFVLFTLERMFEDAKRRGACGYIRDVIILDEAAKFFDDSETNILNIMAREARKFGISMVCASQAPTHFSDDFISSVATKIILGIDEMFWDASARKLRVPLEDMKWVKPRELMLAQVKQHGAAKSGWRQVACC